MRPFIGAETLTEQLNAKVVLFESGCEFLVCRREIDPENATITHIYLREIGIGWMKNGLLWLDPNGPSNQIITKYMRHATYWDKLTENQIIFKTHSHTAMAYFKSPFFRIALEVCDSFKFAQKVSRENEDTII